MSSFWFLNCKLVTVSFLLVGIVILPQSGLTAKSEVDLGSCCPEAGRYEVKPGHFNRFHKYYRTVRVCGTLREAIIFYLKQGGITCVDPEQRWTKQLRKRIDIYLQRNTLDTVNTRGSEPSRQHVGSPPARHRAGTVARGEGVSSRMSGRTPDGSGPTARPQWGVDASLPGDGTVPVVTGEGDPAPSSPWEPAASPNGAGTVSPHQPTGKRTASSHGQDGSGPTARPQWGVDASLPGDGTVPVVTGEGDPAPSSPWEPAASPNGAGTVSPHQPTGKRTASSHGQGSEVNRTDRRALASSPASVPSRGANAAPGLHGGKDPAAQGREGGEERPRRELGRSQVAVLILLPIILGLASVIAYLLYKRRRQHDARYQMTLPEEVEGVYDAL